MNLSNTRAKNLRHRPGDAGHGRGLTLVAAVVDHGQHLDHVHSPPFFRRHRPSGRRAEPTTSRGSPAPSRTRSAPSVRTSTASGVMSSRTRRPRQRNRTPRLPHDAGSRGIQAQDSVAYPRSREAGEQRLPHTAERGHVQAGGGGPGEVVEIQDQRGAEQAQRLLRAARPGQQAGGDRR